jgi:glyoxylase-like metal-dependent hydrolase (beta-lactamase superfamily II)
MAETQFDHLARSLSPTMHPPRRLGDSTRLLDVAPDVACLQLSIVNLFLVGDANEWVLVDAGLWNSAQSIVIAAEERFGRDHPPRAIVLTHGHFDHIGALETLLERWPVPVYAHRLEMPYLNGRSSYPPPDPAVGGGAMAYMSWIFPRGPIDIRSNLRELPADGTVPPLPGWKWLHTPGHAPGHVSLWRESDRLLIAGDAVVTTQQESVIAALTQYAKVWRPPAYYTTDWPAARASAERLAALEPEILATGHGLPMYGGEMRRQLHELATHWELYAPWFGRYVQSPAVCDERGVVSVPPPVVSPQLVMLAGIAAGLLVGGLMLSRSNARY